MSAIHELDLRHLQTPTGPKGAALVRRGKMVMRNPKDVNSICLHQTAVVFGVAPYQIRQAGGDALLAQYMRALQVHAHVTAFDEGTFVAAFPLLAYVWHGNGANPNSVGLEVEGFFNGQPGGFLNANPSKPRTEPTDLLIETARAACTWIVENAAKDGAEIKYYEAHRQHSSDRRSDPGWKLWQEVGINHCEKVLGLRASPMRTTRDGRPIPGTWDPRCTAPY